MFPFAGDYDDINNTTRTYLEAQEEASGGKWPAYITSNRLAYPYPPDYGK